MTTDAQTADDIVRPLVERYLAAEEGLLDAADAFLTGDEDKAHERLDALKVLDPDLGEAFRAFAVSLNMVRTFAEHAKRWDDEDRVEEDAKATDSGGGDG